MGKENKIRKKQSNKKMRQELRQAAREALVGEDQEENDTKENEDDSDD
jgi:hypothetical protein